MRRTLWLESLTVGGILFLILRNGIARYEVFFDEHKATPRAVRFAAIAAMILPVRFYPAGLCLNQKDENGLALEYYRADNHCAIADQFCESQLSGDPAWLRNMTKCYISSQLMDRITFITLVLHRTRGGESREHLIYLSGHYLNFLLQDFFKPQIKVKSLPSITAFLRLVVTPLALILQNGKQRLFQAGVKGNIRENQPRPAVWIELAPNGGLWNQFREFIATDSAGRTYDIVYYLDRPDTPSWPETTRKLENQGFGWIDIITEGHAAHGSAPEIGVDAIAHMAEVVTRLQKLDREKFATTVHPLNGKTVFHTGTITGGTDYATYPERCVLGIEIGTQPGETIQNRVAEIEAIFEEVRQLYPNFKGKVDVKLAREPFTAQGHEGLWQIVSSEMEKETGLIPEAVGENAWGDAQLFQDAGIPTLMFGATGGNLHAPEEWVSLPELTNLARIIAGVARRFCA